MSLLEVRDIHVRRGGSAPRGGGGVVALSGASFRVENGELVAILGANGAGKTTALRAVTGLSPAHAGSVRFDSSDITNEEPRRITGRGIAHVPEGSRIWPGMTVRENLRLGAWSLRREKGSGERLRERLDRVFEAMPRLAERAGQKAGTLSGGERQMAAIGRALMASPRLLLLDEPSLGLAPQVVDAVFEVVAAIRRDGVAVLLVEQNAALALRLAERAYVFENGRVAREGPGRELLEDDAVRRAYLGEIAAVSEERGTG